ncbi:MAG: agmatinase [Desulfobacteraceae bacterium IS3]|nr:MAG: agmatinase [Desulfobacteraceae bacterium IS3]
MMKKPYIPFGGNEIQVPNIDKARIAVLPLCYEKSVSYGTGTREGPIHFLNASEQLECLDEETLTDWGSLGIHTVAPFYPSDDPEKAVTEMKIMAQAILNQEKFLLSVGGDHAVSIGTIMAASTLFPDIGVLQVDAHLDLRNEWNGSRYNHACVMRRVADDMKLPVIQVGIRSFSPEEADYIRKRNFRPFFAHELDTSDNRWIERAVAALPEKVYMTIDLDGLDPSVIPGTGTPEPGGLSYRQLVSLIKAVGRKKKVIAADIVELAKIKGTQVSESAAAKIATKIFVYCL